MFIGEQYDSFWGSMFGSQKVCLSFDPEKGTSWYRDDEKWLSMWILTWPGSVDYVSYSCTCTYYWMNFKGTLRPVPDVRKTPYPPAWRNNWFKRKREKVYF